MNDRPASLLDPQIQKCPFPLYKHLREAKPVSFMADLGVYYIATYDLGRQVLTDSKHFAKKTGQSDGRRFIEPSKAAVKILAESHTGTPLNPITMSEGREHAVYRGVVDARFKVSSVRKMEGFIVETARELIERFEHNGECNLVDEYSMPLPVYVISEMLGLPKSEFRTFKKWSDGVLTYMALLVPEDQAIEGAQRMVEMHQYILKKLPELRASPRDDLLSVLANVRLKDERPLTDREICSYIDELLVAGNSTTTDAISSGLLYLAQHPETYAALRASPDLVPRLVEEVLRITAPLQIAYRYALSDVIVGDVNIPAGSRVFIGLASANRDQCPYPSGDRIDLERKNAGTHITFGAGEHNCLGSELARLELRVTFREWLARFSHIELAQDPDSIEYLSSFALRGPLRVKLRLQRA
jgi:cytochrome P450